MPIFELISIEIQVYTCGKFMFQTGYKIVERFDLKSNNRNVAHWMKSYDHGRNIQCIVAVGFDIWQRGLTSRLGFLRI
jgi:hypothetical protein